MLSSVLWLAAAAAYGPPAPDPRPITAEQAIEAADRLFKVTPPKDGACPESTAGEIVVCRDLVDPTKIRVPSPANSGSTKDLVPRAPNVSSLPDCSRGCIGFGWKPPDPLIIDLKAIPEPPPGSDADRIAKGEIPPP